MYEKDALTGVYTRKAFLELADELLAREPEKQFDIVLSDFVGFKYFNGRYGTKTGDLLLQRTGEMLSNIAPGVLCGRYSGDRFVSLVEKLPPQAMDYLNGFAPPQEAKDELPTGSVVVKFGICTVTDRTRPVSSYCDRAMLAVESVKHSYGKNVAIYDSRIDSAVISELLIEENMNSALEERQFEVYYQPKVDVKSGALCGAEALVRWNHPTLGPMTPKDLIPLFERNGFITALDMYIWENVCRDLSAWREQGLRVVPVSVNVSRRDFSAIDLPEHFLQLTDRYGLERALFHPEVTESFCDVAPEAMLQQLNRLSALGFPIELDDFGTGYTSLSCLCELQFNILKLDRSLLKKGSGSPGKMNALSLAMNLAKMMGVVTVQEGVETAEELALLKVLGTDMAQGYYFSKPLPKEDFEKWLSGNESGMPVL